MRDIENCPHFLFFEIFAKNYSKKMLICYNEVGKHKGENDMNEIFKVEVYLPEEALENIKQGLYDCGFGKVGNYDCCLSWYQINSSWRPIDGANPYLGKVGEIEFAPEFKIEFRCEEKDLEKAVKVIKENHPYEEVCINIIPLKIL